MDITVSMELAKVTPEAYLFIGEFIRLLEENKSFILRYKLGKKLYLDTCNGVQRKCFICMKEHETNKVSAINCAIAFHSRFDVVLENNCINFAISIGYKESYFIQDLLHL